MKAADDEGETLQEQTNHRQQISLANMFHCGYEFPLRDDIDRIDRGWPRAMVDPLQAVQMALGQPLTLMHRIDTDITSHTLGRRRFANAEGLA